MARTCEESRAARAWASQPRQLPAPVPPPPATLEPEPGPLPQLARLEALLSHTSIWAFQRRLAQEFMQVYRLRADKLDKLVARLEKLIAHNQRHTPPGTRTLLNRIYNPAYAALYEPPLPG